jgi:hypothetical protein
MRINYILSNCYLDETVSQVYYLTFMYSATCFGRPHTHHQELNCSSSLWFNRCSVLIAALLPPRSYGKPEAAAAVDRLLMMGIGMPETC